MTTPSAHRSPTDRVPAPALVLVSILSVQFGSAVARTGTSWVDWTDEPPDGA